MKFGLNLYPPYLLAGVRVTSIAPDWRELHVSLKLRWFNRNFRGTHFGGSLYETEVRYLMEHEWARTAEDVLWRRTKLGLRLNESEVAQLEAWMKKNKHLRTDGEA